MSDTNLFGSNQKFKEAVTVINELDGDKFPLLIQRIIKKLDIKTEAIFNEAEFNQLQSIFNCGTNELQSVLDSCSFIFEQAGYFGISPEILALQLEKSGVVSAKVKRMNLVDLTLKTRSFAHVWKDEAAEYVAKLRKKTLVPLEADSVNWRLHLQIGQNNLYRLKEPTAILQLGLHTTSETKARSEESITLEFGHKELYEFFEQLETIQEQLDNLG